ncbi:tRNA epoxyqueuosine(34) reductase QueG [Catenovulum maritimum]|uniref:Epoxyqueuosine reductase n=1 Tax=Catenovulum maritimum TaxID=1513271 RepID=A0A0J8GNP5_9ALTE|nr:tRNA epoxyqueuosine(34) reductase QueG [Catenovulum maritimum]KMT64407.1 [Fe-S]-binding protein [Catenovulum maritimum]
MTTQTALNSEQLAQLSIDIKKWGKELGFQHVGISSTELLNQDEAYQKWIKNNYHGDMDYMNRNIDLRLNPAQLHPNTASIISVRLDYLPENAGFSTSLNDPNKAYISRYAIGRDYHKVLRNKLKQLGQKIELETELNIGFRPFVDSAPVLERPIAEQAGLGWTGKHTLIIHKDAGSWFFLGELFINLPLVEDQPVQEECGNCVACITICPTAAIVEPYVVDARKCISYLTIELQGSIPVEYREAIGNRIYGCDDCQLVCPWNRYADLSQEKDFEQRHGLLSQDLLALWQWDEETFLTKTQGSPIRRIGYQRWLRNLAIGIGNSSFNPANIAALESKLVQADEIAAEHINWAIAQQQLKQSNENPVNKKTARLIRVIEKGLPRDA